MNHLTSDTIVFSQHGVIHPHVFTGHWVKDNINLIQSQQSSSSSSSFSLPLLTIDSPLLSFTSPFTGHLGLAPPYRLQDQRSSFLQNAYNNKVIDHMVFALYTSKNESVLSSIKFGSFDQSAIADREQLTYMKTVSTNSWAIRAHAMHLAGSQVKLTTADRAALIQPLLPYTYIPKADFQNFRLEALMKYATRGLHCTNIDCYFEKPCNESLP